MLGLLLRNFQNNYQLKYLKRSELLLTFPIARRPLSKKSITPRKRNVIPKPVSPTPISAITRTLFKHTQLPVNRKVTRGDKTLI